MNFTQETVYHVYNRGNNKQSIFFQEDDYLLFLKKMRAELLPHADILAYCLMPNHFHFLLFVKKIDESMKIGSKSKTLNQAIAVVLRSYTRVKQNQELFTGSLFQQKTKAKEIVEAKYQTLNYLSVCAHYIHQNPVRGNLVSKLNQWKFSSYLDYSRERNGRLCNRDLFYSLAGIDEKSFIEESEEMIFNTPHQMSKS